MELQRKVPAVGRHRFAIVNERFFVRYNRAKLARFQMSTDPFLLARSV